MTNIGVDGSETISGIEAMATNVTMIYSVMTAVVLLSWIVESVGERFAR